MSNRKPKPFRLDGQQVIRCEQQGKVRLLWPDAFNYHVTSLTRWKQDDHKRYATWLPKAIAWRDAKKGTKR